MNKHGVGVTRGSENGWLDSQRGLPRRLLSNEPRLVNVSAQSALTERYLLPALADLAVFFLALRRLVDAELLQRQPIKLGKPYPVGQCLEITLAVKQRFMTANAAVFQEEAAIRGFAAFNAFRKAGGTIRQVWGDLRGEFFQNAFQVGTLYVDVANDSVTTSKPKVEILPFAEARLVPIANYRHFTHLATAYWQGDIFPNHVLPEWAPTCPLIHVMPNNDIRIVEATQYMVALAQANAFRASEEVLRDALMPADIFAQVVNRLAGSHWKVARSPEQGRAAALRACREQRAKKWHFSPQRASKAILASLEVNRCLAQRPNTSPHANSFCIDHHENESSALKTDAQRQVVNLRIVDQEITRLQQRLAICQTARASYAQALSAELQKRVGEIELQK